MTSIAIAIQSHPTILASHLKNIIRGILLSFSDSEPKIRCAGIKAAYETIRSLRDKGLPVFTEIVEKMMGCICDCEEPVRQACGFLNSQLEDVLFSDEDAWGEE